MSTFADFRINEIVQLAPSTWSDYANKYAIIKDIGINPQGEYIYLVKLPILKVDTLKVEYIEYSVHPANLIKIEE